MKHNKPLLLLTVLLCAAGCSTTSSAPRAAGPVSAAEQQDLTSRVQAARDKRALIERSIELEDAPRNGKAKSQPVAEQLHAARERAREAEPSTPFDAARVSTYEAAVRELETAYLGSQLESTDPAQKPGEWASDEGRDQLGSATVDAKLASWQALDPERPFVKFAVVRLPSGELVTRVGRLDVGHVDIAGGLALSAGLLHSEVQDGKARVVVLENTSGGFRPGPLRNRITLEALRAAGYLPASAADLTVHDNPTGGYDHSALITPSKH